MTVAQTTEQESGQHRHEHDTYGSHGGISKINSLCLYRHAGAWKAARSLRGDEGLQPSTARFKTINMEHVRGCGKDRCWR